MIKWLTIILMNQYFICADNESRGKIRPDFYKCVVYVSEMVVCLTVLKWQRTFLKALRHIIERRSLNRINRLTSNQTGRYSFCFKKKEEIHICVMQVSIFTPVVKGMCVFLLSERCVKKRNWHIRVQESERTFRKLESQLSSAAQRSLRQRLTPVNTTFLEGKLL